MLKITILKNVLAFFVIAILPLTDADDSGCPSKKWVFFNGICYKVSKEERTWPDAKSVCEELDGNLMQFFNEGVVKKIPIKNIKHVWIGLHKPDPKKNEWSWSDGSEATFFKWDVGQPQNEGESCAAALTLGKWHDYPCSAKFKFVCQKESSF
ncbi:C-type lectin-like isoform X2 [Physella acuta]|uniref:C-type lectin-like isoform X2 n=1 Tax=Physella acuta TaxID=109671 RepID=UPI0027DE9E95|nr:C-type lectin-like isoform X2 [Physella acuta]XP_059178371.1 C-type lectin-like isoform X2 [Physella acuta]XP_059178372.1 C-type lectin-like isoform X2 [Physella acuta]